MLKNIHKVYPGDVAAVKNFNLEIEDKEFIVLVGPSGCGKSTTLRMIAGLEEPTKGELYIGERLVNGVPPKDRDIAMVFQNYALYPHMTVYKNMAFALELRNVPKDEIDKRVRQAAQALDIEHLLGRKPRALSGGQRQRVALGRAMVRKPMVFLLDEPLSNLDAKLRSTMRTELIKLHRQLGTTFVYVTHDQTEATTMGDRIVVMDEGVIQQVDTPQALYDTPCNLFVAGFIGSPQMNFWECELGHDESGYFISVDGKRLLLHPERVSSITGAYTGKTVTLGIRPEDIYNDPDYIQSNPEIVMDMTVDIIEPMGSEVYMYLSDGSTKLTARVSARRSNARAGDRITIAVDPHKVHLFNHDTGIAIAK